MRTNFEWSEQRLTAIWKVQPGRSSLHIVPPGCDTHAAASTIAAWVATRDSTSPIRENSRAAIASISADSTSSSAHFVRKIHAALTKVHKVVSEATEERYPADWIENIVAATQSDGGHPVLIINRFHSFAAIADDNLLSVLSTLRQLEHDGNLTTIAISPITYQALRRELAEKGQFPFVNSAYGDNHDETVMPPLTRNEFVAAATRAGLSPKRSNALFAECGGPDCVHQAVITAAMQSETDIVESAVRLVGNKLDRFFDILMGSGSPESEDLRFRAATGQLLPAQAAYLRHQSLAAFLLRDGPRGTSIVASPVVSRLLLQGRAGPWIAYSKVLKAIDAGQYSDAARQTALLEQDGPNLKVFAGLLNVLAALHDSQNGGLLEIDWKTARRISQNLIMSRLPIEPYKEWLGQITKWADLVSNAINSGQGSGARLDVLTQRAYEHEIRTLILYAIELFLKRVRRSGSPGEQVRAAASIPESVLQAIAAFLGIDPLRVPEKLPELDYQMYFGVRGEYRRPSSGEALDLTHLLVIVPAMLSARYPIMKDEISICDSAYVKPLHQSLVARMRNATAHTYSEMNEATANDFFDICSTLLADARVIWQRENGIEAVSEPDNRVFADLLAGRVGEGVVQIELTAAGT
ncbi:MULTISPECIES: hypothetical protein [Rhizobium]|jgi:hypothetical protein|uniref:hypothetical protein n=2 Tax=Rhizobium/Agrobacterium group TaxID=227290 RepID=UPI0003A7E2BA|nr:hypothetical protein [Rhizobium leguminosarum]MBA8831714.1 hypothetical protein [Rhizobium leguminosarum]MDH6271299.1 hypothetical protein [Rhizobium leguminosarum]MVO92366.1 hypothetical protein [Rhizobium leguminosarum bv. phaseoli]